VQPGWRQFPVRAFVNSSGQTARSAAELLPTDPVISADKAALMLSAPAIEFEYLPRPLWVGIEFANAGVPGRWTGAVPGEAPSMFRAAVDRAIGDAAAVGVSFSGGLDSLAVLWHADRLCQASHRQLIATVINLEDDEGASAAGRARELIRDLGIQAELIVIDPQVAKCRAGNWSADGPSFMSMPDLVAAASDTALATGAEVLMDGVGGDETLQFAGFGLPAFLRQAGVSAALRYLRDVIKFDRQAGVIGELAALAGGVLPGRFSCELYHAFHWTHLLDEHASVVVSDRYRHEVATYLEEWLQGRISQFMRVGRNWSRMAALDGLCPFEPLQPAGELPVRSPFLEEDFVRYAASLPLPARYDHRAPLPYHRWKALTASLFPPAARRALPRHKQLYRQALSRYRSARPPAERLSEQFGIVRSGQTFEPRVGRSIRALDDWLAGALDRGARVTA
jgi:Asparagine synthase